MSEAENNPAEDLELALAELERLAGKGRKPSHRHARDLLVPLGQLLLETGAGELDPVLGRIEGLVEPLGKSWQEALEAELRMACTEHCQAVDLRFLSLPNYDFDYTVRARELLEARLLAADALGHLIEAGLLGRVQQADATLEPFLRAREGDPPLN